MSGEFLHRVTSVRHHYKQRSDSVASDDFSVWAGSSEIIGTRAVNSLKLCLATKRSDSLVIHSIAVASLNKSGFPDCFQRPVQYKACCSDLISMFSDHGFEACLSIRSF